MWHSSRQFLLSACCIPGKVPVLTLGIQQSPNLVKCCAFTELTCL